jgi:hypothetical protein
MVQRYSRSAAIFVAWRTYFLRLFDVDIRLAQFG